MKNKLIVFLILSLCCSGLKAQEEDSLSIRTQRISQLDTLQGDYKAYDALAPAKAAFYSAVLPGLGQAYNGRYWKIPLVYAGVGAGIYFYIDNNKKYHRYRDAYKRRLAGYQDDEFQGVLQTKSLINAQKQFRRQKDLSLLVTVAFYVLNIIDANVDAHLQQFNVDNNLSLQPNFRIDEYSGRSNYGLSFNLNF